MVHYLHVILFGYDYLSIFSSEIIWSLCSFHKTEYRLFLLEVDSQDRSPNLKIVFKHLIQMQRCLNLHQSSKFRRVVFDVKLPRIIFVNMRVQSADGDVVNSDVCVVASAESNFADVVEVDDVDASLFVLFVFVGVHLERFNQHVVILGLLQFEYLESLFADYVSVLQLFFAELTVEGLPRVSGHVGSDLFVFLAAPPSS